MGLGALLGSLGGGLAFAAGGPAAVGTGTAIGSTVGTAATVGGIAAGTAAASGAFDDGPDIPDPQQPPGRSGAEAQEAATRERRRAAAAQGRSGTILTGGQGAELTQQSRKTLLGS